MNINFNIMLALALAVLLGTFGARMFKRWRIPQVVAFLIIGVLLGSSGLRVIDMKTAESLAPLSLLALGITGFSIGGELKIGVFRRYGQRLFVILLAEGLGAFAFVTVLVGVITGNWPLGLLLGAISSATAPAATMDVLWESRALGMLTKTITTVVALDNGLTLLLFGFATAIARVLLDGGGFRVMTVVRPIYDIIGAVMLGAAVGLVFRLIQRRTRERELVLAFTLGSVLLLVGCAEAFGVNMILAAMVFGSVFTNLAGRAGEEVFGIVRRFAPPIYVLFFVLVGARLQLGVLTLMMWLAVIGYLAGRVGGKLLGVRIAARLTRAPEVIRSYLGFALLSQAGVAVGLAVLASQTFSHHPEVSAAVVGIITVTVFASELFGPPAARYAVTRAGEVGRNVTEEDLLESYRVRDVMKTDQPSLHLRTPLPRVLDSVAASDAIYFPVVDDDNRFRGVITLEGLKTILNMPHVDSLLVAQDLMDEMNYTVTPDLPLNDAQQLIKDRQRDYLVVVDPEKRDRFVGLLIERRVQRLIEEEIAQRRRTAEVDGTV